MKNASIWDQRDDPEAAWEANGFASVTEAEPAYDGSVIIGTLERKYNGDGTYSQTVDGKPWTDAVDPAAMKTKQKRATRAAISQRVRDILGELGDNTVHGNNLRVAVATGAALNDPTSKAQAAMAVAVYRHNLELKVLLEAGVEIDVETGTHKGPEGSTSFPTWPTPEMVHQALMALSPPPGVAVGDAREAEPVEAKASLSDMAAGVESGAEIKDVTIYEGGVYWTPVTGATKYEISHRIDGGEWQPRIDCGVNNYYHPETAPTGTIEFAVVAHTPGGEVWSQDITA